MKNEQRFQEKKPTIKITATGYLKKELKKELKAEKKKNRGIREKIYFWRKVSTALLMFLIIAIIIILCTCGAGGRKVEEPISTAEAQELQTAELAEPVVNEDRPYRLETYIVTAYCSCKKCCGKTDGITASGVKAVEGVTIAADTSRLPFGTQVEIDGTVYTVQDRGGAIKGNKIDIYFSSHEKALAYGCQTKKVKIFI